MPVDTSKAMSSRLEELWQLGHEKISTEDGSTTAFSPMEGWVIWIPTIRLLY
ncbi:unnamed protein product [marine sediment metagenome]|uniref:Uncharacterized protein n=1 Tax=marine sediment metagenome TaxID=412755 RepID=X1Q2D5_9ZZZZ